MMDRLDQASRPTLEEVGKYVNNPVFLQFCSRMEERYQCSEKIEFSSCSMEKGWNVKYKKAGKALCTVYPREGYFTVMVVVGTKEKAFVEAMLPDCAAELQEIYGRTREGNGQRWLMLDLKEPGALYDDVFRLMDIRKGW